MNDQTTSKPKRLSADDLRERRELRARELAEQMERNRQAPQNLIPAPTTIHLTTIPQQDEIATSQNSDTREPLEDATALEPLDDIASTQSSSDTEVQNSDTALSQSDEIAVTQDSSTTVEQESNAKEVQESVTQGTQQSVKAEEHISEDASSQDSFMTDKRLELFAKMLQEYEAKEQQRQAARSLKDNPAEQLINALASLELPQDSLFAVQLSQFREIATEQQSKITRGMSIPGALFTLYNECAHELTRLAKGRRTNTGDLMARVLITGLVEDIIPEMHRLSEAAKERKG